MLRRTLALLTALLTTAALTVGITAPASASEPVFEDVPPGAAFYDDITWLYDSGITTGVDLDGDGVLEFAPTHALTRDAAVTWIARCLGQPMTVQDAPAWAVDAGISTVPASDSSWQDPVTREAMAAFLYRAAGSPAFRPPWRSPFEDLTRTSAFYREITWLWAEGITTGVDLDGDGRPEFAPTDPVRREAGAAWLHLLDGDIGH